MRNSPLNMMQWETRVSEAYHMVECCRMDSAAANEYTDKHIRAEIQRKWGKRSVYSVYMKGFVAGLCRARDNRIMRELVEYCYLENGILYSTHKQSAHRSTEEFYSAGRGCELGNLPSGFYWNGTDKPFFRAGETTPFRGSTVGA